jgi:hypothetical protein
MKKIQYCFAILMAVSVQACTQRAWYEGAKQSQRNECYKAPPSAREECLKAINSDSYDEYQRKKQEEIEKDNQGNFEQAHRSS